MKASCRKVSKYDNDNEGDDNMNNTKTVMPKSRKKSFHLPADVLICMQAYIDSEPLLQADDYVATIIIEDLKSKGFWPPTPAQLEESHKR
jgi:hypothetical protein